MLKSSELASHIFLEPILRLRSIDYFIRSRELSFEILSLCLKMIALDLAWLLEGTSEAQTRPRLNLSAISTMLDQGLHDCLNDLQDLCFNL